MQPQHEAAGLRGRFGVGLAAVTAAALVACGGGSDGSDASGSLNLSITDAPVDEAEHVFIQFSSVTLKQGNEFADDEGIGGDGLGGDDPSAFETIEFDEPRRIDLLAQRNGASARLLRDERIPAGRFESIRLGVDLGIGESVMIAGGREFDLEIPSGAESGLRIVEGFTVAEGGLLDLTIDFDLRRSLVESPPGSGIFRLRPSLRLVRTDDAGEIAVRASSGFINDRCPDDNEAQAIYVFAGDNVTPDDVDITTDSTIDPVTTAGLSLDNATGDFIGTAAFLRPGTHTVAFTCDPENDLPESDEGNDDVDGDVFFEDVTTLDVVAGESSSLELTI